MSGAVRTTEANGPKSYRFLYFSQLLKLPVCCGQIRDRLGRLTDIVFRIAEPYPEAVGIYIEHGWGKPTEFIPWDKVLRIEDDAIFVAPPPEGAKHYGPFVDQPGWIMANEHLMGKTILDMDGRRIEVVNDVHLMESKGRVIIVHVDISFNGFLRKWGLSRLGLTKDHFISWRYVQPLSLEDAAVKGRGKDVVTLSVTRRQLAELPSEDLADALEELSGEEQQAVFQALDSEKAAATLVEAEPRAQRQIIANLRKERARTILSEMSIPQLSDLFSVLPHDDREELLALLPPENAQRVREILSERTADARDLMSAEFVSVARDAKVGDVLRAIRVGGHDRHALTYLYVLNEEKTLVGVVDLRELLLAGDEQIMADLMTSPVVSAEEDDAREDVAELFAKYHYRMLPVVDRKDHLLGVIHYNDIMRALGTRTRT